MRRFPEVVEASTVSGEADAVLRILAADMRHFEKVLEQISAAPFVVRTKSVLVLSPLLRRPGAPARPLTQRSGASRTRNTQQIVDDGQRRGIVARRHRFLPWEHLGLVAAATPRNPWSVPVTSVLSRPSRRGERIATRRHYLMCPPDALRRDLRDQPLDATRRGRSTSSARSPSGTPCARTYLDLGHRVDLLDPVPGLPDMVFAANGATVVDGVVYGARFRHAERGPEAAAHRAWFRAAGFARVVDPEFVNEGEGDLLVAGAVILAGSGFRTDPRAHAEAARVLGRGWSARAGRPALLPPRHGAGRARRRPPSPTPGGVLARVARGARRRYPDAVLATAADAAVLGLNAVSDGRHVVLPAEATDLAAALAERGFVPVPVDLSELLKGGGGPKCCTLEVRA